VLLRDESRNLNRGKYDGEHECHCDAEPRLRDREECYRQRRRECSERHADE
jgi:hypothetical protein